MNLFESRTRVTHHDLAGRRIGEIDELGIWGDEMRNKPEGAFRIVFQNINGFTSKLSQKDYTLYEFIKEREIDIIGCAEVNVNWSMTRNENSLYKRTTAWSFFREIAQALTRRQIGVRNTKEEEYS